MSSRRLRICQWSTGGVLFVVVLMTAQCVVIILDRFYGGPSQGVVALCSGEVRQKIMGGSGAVSLRSAPIESPPTSFSSTAAAASSASELPTEFEGVLARPFERWGDRPMPCVPAEADWQARQKDPARKGFLFAKPYKTGSSTASGVNLRLARNVARRPWRKANESTSSDNEGATMCLARSDHVWASRAFADRDRGRSFLWTVLREPSRRLVSQFFHFQVSRHKEEPTDANFASYVRDGPSDMLHDYYYRALSLREFPTETAPNSHSPGNNRTMADLGNDILADYDFIGITERMDESIVVLALLLGIPLGDVLYLTAKGHGGFDDGGGRGPNVCTYIWPSFVSKGMQRVLDSEAWRHISHWDRVLYEAANRSLDLTIERLGRDRVADALRLFQNALAMGRERCLPRTVFPCSEGGDYTPASATDCLWKDSGCGSACLDEVARELNL